MPESNDRGHSAETSLLAVPGEVKIDICRRLGDGWPDLADYVQIPSHGARSALMHVLHDFTVPNWLSPMH